MEGNSVKRIPNCVCGSGMPASVQGRRHGFESGGGDKNFFDPPLFGQWRGQNIAVISLSIQAASRKIVDGVMRHTPG